MFEYAMNIIQEKIKFLANTNKNQTEIYLGVSNLNNSIKDFLSEHGWRALYVEAGIFQLNRL